MPSKALRCVAIMGATGIGKSALAIELAEEFGGEILSMDSRQVYRRLDIGTAKVGAEERARVAHHLIDFLDPDQEHSAGRHCELAEEVSAAIIARGRLPFLVGGTGFYFRALFEGLIETAVGESDKRAARRRLEEVDTAELYEDLQRIDPVRAGEVSPNDRVRIMRAMEIFLTTGTPPTAHSAIQPPVRPWDGPRFVLTAPRGELRRRIAERTASMYERGWIEEVISLVADGMVDSAPAMDSLGYARIAEAVRWGDDPRATLAAVVTQTQQYAKRQETFFRSIANAVWIDVCSNDPVNRMRETIRSWAGL